MIFCLVGWEDTFLGSGALRLKYWDSFRLDLGIYSIIDSQLPFVPVGKMKQKGLCVMLLRFFDSF